MITQIAAIERESQIGFEKSGLVTAIKPLPFKPQTMKRRGPDHFGHRVGQLNFTAGAAFMAAQMTENLRL